MALTSLSRECFQSVAAVTVDHGLRPESAEEAAAVRSMIRGLGMYPRIFARLNIDTTQGEGFFLCVYAGIDHFIRRLEWLPQHHRGNVQSLARDRRLEVFRRILVECRADYMLTAHHLDDQVHGDAQPPPCPMNCADVYNGPAGRDVCPAPGWRQWCQWAGMHVGHDHYPNVRRRAACRATLAQLQQGSAPHRPAKRSMT